VAPKEPALRLAAQAAATPGLRLCGLMGYEGHVLSIPDPVEKRRACHRALDLLLASRDLLLANGLPVDIVSAGGTGCYEITAAYPGITEVQAGGGVFMDAMYRYGCHVASLDFALTCLATVTSRCATHVVVDAGFKSMSAYHHAPLPLERDDLELRGLSAEHGIFSLRDDAAGPRVGDKVRFIVGYGDSTTVLHDALLGVRRGRVECVWQIAGRGCLQ
jgi:D-serine deaminase-like pyridoxal phosphate-dependent protein